MRERAGMSLERLGRRARPDDLRNDPPVLADLPVANEPESFESRQSAVIEEARGNGACGLGVSLDPAPTEFGDEIERPRECRCRDTLTPESLADVVARDPPVRQVPQALLVLGTVLDPRHLVGRAELTPAQTVVAVEHKGRMRAVPQG